MRRCTALRYPAVVAVAVCFPCAGYCIGKSEWRNKKKPRNEGYWTERNDPKVRRPEGQRKDEVEGSAALVSSHAMQGGEVARWRDVDIWL